jgi:AraC-like DNA-binding protein
MAGRGRESSGVMITSLQAAAIVAGLVGAGVDPTEVFARAGIPLADLGDPERRFPREAMHVLWSEAQRASGDPAFGLHIAERIPYGSFGVIEYVARSSSTLGEALSRVARYVRLVDDAAEIAFVEAPGSITIVPGTSDAWPIPAEVMEGLLAFTLRMARELSGKPELVPVAVELRRHRPADAREHARIFGVEASFGAARNGVTFASAQLALPVVRADPALSAILDRHAAELLRKLPPAQTLSQRARALLAAELRGGDPTLERIAPKLGIGDRTLRRRLKEEGTSVTEILDELRRELALRYLEEDTMTLDAIAFELGFADARAFRRAFKRWTGRVPRGT